MSPRRLLLAAALAAALAGAPDLASAKTILVPVTLVGGVPVPCGAERLGTCHNRWHFALHPVATAEPGDTLVFQTRDALDNQFNRTSTAATVAAANLNRVHPLTGPVFVKGAKPGDVLAVTIEKIEPGPDRFGYTVIVPGFGFLRDVFPNPAIVRWDLDSSGAVSRDMPGVRVPMNGFTGTIGVALGPGETRVAFQREEQLRPLVVVTRRRLRRSGRHLWRRRFVCGRAHALLADDPAPRERRQHGRQADDRGNDPSLPLLRRRLSALYG